MRSRFFGVAALVLLSACSRSSLSSAHQQRAVEFSRLHRAVVLVQSAKNEDKAEPLLRLRALSCERLCVFRDRCVTAYEKQVNAVHQVHLLKRQLEKGQSKLAQSELQVLGLSLGAAQAELQNARPLMQDCAALQGELQREFEKK